MVEIISATIMMMMMIIISINNNYNDDDNNKSNSFQFNENLFIQSSLSFLSLSSCNDRDKNPKEIEKRFQNNNVEDEILHDSYN